MEKCLLFNKLIIPSVRQFSTSSVRKGKRNFRQFALHNFRGSAEFREKHHKLSLNDPDIPYYTYGVREPGYTKDDVFHLVPELVPELIVPDLTDFKLKPYVSYKAADVYQDPFTSRDLFEAVYSPKIREDFKNGKLNENGEPLEPSDFEKMTAEEATIKARQTGTDIFEDTKEEES